MIEYYETIKRYIDNDKTEDITDSILIESLPMYNNELVIEDVVKELIWFLRADDNLQFLWDDEDVTKKVFSPLEGQTKLRFFKNKDGERKLSFHVTQVGIDLLEEAPYWMLYYSIFHKVITNWKGVKKGGLVYNFDDSYIVTDEGETHLPEFQKGFEIEIADKHPQKLKVEDFKLVKK